jgi:uncharacterized protein
MPDDGSKLRDVLALADAAARVDLAVPVAALDRLAQQLVSAEGVATGDISFSRLRGFVRAEVRLSAKLHVVCQRCMRPFALPVQCQSEVVLVDSEEVASGVADAFETALAPGGRLRLRDLVEEELLLALPTAPRHEDMGCTGSISDRAADQVDTETQLPFSNLGKLLGSSRLKK